MRTRDQRQKLFIRARVRTGEGWHDACIIDVSRRGAGLKAAQAPRRGAYVEIRRGMHVIVARVVWSMGQRFGVAAQDDIPIHLVADDRAPADHDGSPPAPDDRRMRLRRVADRAETSRNWARRAQFAAIALAGMAAAMVVGAQVRSALAAPLGQIGVVLDR